ncbi:MAG: hypothetical protein M1838_002080 [Thelocarpon superellum]|nr:MAG: hypothetical protein M1838_002080 [Thelocarpon superellum]
MGETHDDPAAAGREEFREQDPGYEASLGRAIQELQGRIQDQEESLSKRKSSTDLASIVGPSPTPAERLRQTRLLTAAYESLTAAEPTLPPPDSPLPALLALRETQRLIAETETSSAEVQEKLKHAQTRYETEKSYLRDARLITTSLEKRIGRLRQQLQERSRQPPTQDAKDLIKQLDRRQARHRQETKTLVQAFNDFLDEHLATMLAAEELGGPVVGEAMDLDDEELEGGFSQQGTAKRVKASGNEDARQRRIEAIWGPDESLAEDEHGPRTEADAAGAEMRALTEELLNASAAAGGSGSGEYVEVTRDSAAVRFLVRARVAQLHPKDARRVRLIDFGREVED